MTGDSSEGAALRTAQTPGHSHRICGRACDAQSWGGEMRGLLGVLGCDQGIRDIRSNVNGFMLEIVEVDLKLGDAV